MSLPSPIIAVLAHVEPLFTAPTWKKVMTLLVGTMLARGRRTVTTGTALWYSTGTDPLPIRWVLTRVPEGKREPKAYFSTNQAQSAAEIVEDFVKRWPIEGTFEESRAHLGVETQRQWSDLAIERSAPCLFGLYSVVVLLGHALHPDGAIPVQQAAWYHKTQATFSDVLATVRRHCWGGLTFQTSPADPDVCLVSRSDLTRLVQAACS
jgi:hypothetical protein